MVSRKRGRPKKPYGTSKPYLIKRILSHKQDITLCNETNKSLRKVPIKILETLERVYDLISHRMREKCRSGDILGNRFRTQLEERKQNKRKK